jgi:hypothetical protein
VALEILWDRYNDTVNTNPELAERLGIHSFEEEIHHLLQVQRLGNSAHWKNESSVQQLGHPTRDYGVPTTAPTHQKGKVCQSTELPPGHADLLQLP